MRSDNPVPAMLCASISDLVEALMPIEDRWFWSEEWQAMEQEADEELTQGRYHDFETMDDMVADLVSREKVALKRMSAFWDWLWSEELEEETEEETNGV